MPENQKDTCKKCGATGNLSFFHVYLIETLGSEEVGKDWSGGGFSPTKETTTYSVHYRPKSMIGAHLCTLCLRSLRIADTRFTFLCGIFFLIPGVPLFGYYQSIEENQSPHSFFWVALIVVAIAVAWWLIEIAYGVWEIQTNEEAHTHIMGNQWVLETLKSELGFEVIGLSMPLEGGKLVGYTELDAKVLGFKKHFSSDR